MRPDKVDLEPNFSRDVTNIGHFGTGNLEITITTDDDIEKAKEYINLSYDNS